MVLHAMGHGRAMVQPIGMSETIDRILPVAEGKHGWRGDEAKGCERGEHYRHPEAEPGRECGQHGLGNRSVPEPRFQA